jgi:hypothetical protein
VSNPTCPFISILTLLKKEMVPYSSTITTLLLKLQLLLFSLVNFEWVTNSNLPIVDDDSSLSLSDEFAEEWLEWSD